MNSARSDGSAGDADYGAIGVHYARFRQPDPRIAAVVDQALGDAVSVLNVGAGSGSYEPTSRMMTAVEPSAVMRAQRPAHLSTAINATAERLPFPDLCFDAAMATFTVHQWADLGAGLRELRRVARGPVLILTCDPDELNAFWLAHYAPEVIAVEARRYPRIDAIVSTLGGNADVLRVSIPLDCRDGFGEAYYGRPESLLDPEVRQACSAWSFVRLEVVERFVAALSRDLASGVWDARFGRLRSEPCFMSSLKLIVARP